MKRSKKHGIIYSVSRIFRNKRLKNSAVTAVLSSTDRNCAVSALGNAVNSASGNAVVSAS